MDAKCNTDSVSGARQTHYSAAFIYPRSRRDLHERKLRDLERKLRGLHERKLEKTRLIRESNASRSKATRASTTNVRRSADLQLPNLTPAEDITETSELHRGSLLQDGRTAADRVIRRSHLGTTTSSLEAPKKSREAAKPSNLAFIPEQVATTAPQSKLQPNEGPRSTSLHMSPVVKNGSHPTCQEELATPSSDEEGAGVIGKLSTTGFASGSRSKQRRERLFHNETQKKLRDLQRQLQVLDKSIQIQVRHLSVLDKSIQLQVQEISRAFGKLRAGRTT